VDVRDFGRPGNPHGFSLLNDSLITAWTWTPTSA
jgi:hypothetical protein